MQAQRMMNYTVKDIYALPDGERAELIDGEMYMMTPPNRIHQKLVHQLDKLIGNYIDSGHGECEVYPAPFAVFLNADNHTYVEPDLSVICDKNKLDDRGCSGAPDLIIEIVSPSSRKMDYNLKNGKYAEVGVREYWIIDPEKERLTIYYYEKDAAPVFYPFDSPVEVNIFPELIITVSELLK